MKTIRELLSRSGNQERAEAAKKQTSGKKSLAKNASQRNKRQFEQPEKTPAASGKKRSRKKSSAEKKENVSEKDQMADLSNTVFKTSLDAQRTKVRYAKVKKIMYK